MESAEVERRAEALGPWVNAFEFDGALFPRQDRAAGDSELVPRRGRAQAFFEFFPDARRILELGSLEGADTMRLASRPGTTVTGIEGRAEHIARAQFVADLHGLINVTFVHGDVEAFDLNSIGPFDAVLCTGLLYHLRRPWELLQSLGGVTDRLFLSTHYWGGEAMGRDEGFALKVVHEDHPETRTRALVPTVRWFNRDSLIDALRRSGFTQVAVIHERRTDTVCDFIAACTRNPADVDASKNSDSSS